MTDKHVLLPIFVISMVGFPVKLKRRADGGDRHLGQNSKCCHLTRTQSLVIENSMSETTEDLSSLNFEDALKHLENIVRKLESGDVPLDQSIDLYSQGEKLRGLCQQRLEAAQAKIEKITLDRNGKPQGTAPFDAD
jgi:exodeoxyribonuclease VII small subunit